MSSRSRRALRFLAVAVATTVLGFGLIGTAYAAVPATATQIASAIASPSANVTGAAFVATPNVNANGTATSSIGGFPVNGPSYGVLSTGNVAGVEAVNTFQSTSWGGPNVRGNTDFDVTILRVDLNVQAGANCLTFSFKFLSEEYPDYVGTQYNDAFIAELDTSTWTTSGSAITAPNNFAFDASGNVVSINSTGIGNMTAAQGAGTAFNGGAAEGGATTLLGASTQVTPGAQSLYLSIFDQGDHIWDSAVFIDNLRVGFVPNPAVNCRPGAEVQNFLLSLSPLTDSNPVGTQHTVTATLTNAAGGPIANAPIAFTVAGVNPTSGSSNTNASGLATFTYTGTAAGLDSIGACYDADATPPCEAVASAEKTWVNAPPTANAGGPYSGVEGSPVAISGTATDPEGQPLTTTWSIAPVSGVDAGTTCSFANAAALSTTVTCTDNGTFALTLTASDGVNPPVASAPATLVLANAPPDVSISAPTEGSLYAVGSTVGLTAPFTDPGANDTHTCTVNWDDGAGAVAGSVAQGAGSGTCSASKTFTAAGVYTITVTVTDDDGASDSASVMIIVYDPSAGFVTGGGFIDSPAGAYTADPTLTGKASFGFVSKYQKGTTTPTGETEFQFKAGDLNFHSESYQWLVVAGNKAQYKGTGTINGESGYSFLLTAYDGQLPGGGGVDRFRIKIWNTATGAIVYDNNLGGSDDIDAAAPMAVSGGSIVIHK